MKSYMRSATAILAAVFGGLISVDAHAQSASTFSPQQSLKPEFRDSFVGPRSESANVSFSFSSATPRNERSWGFAQFLAGNQIAPNILQRSTRVEIADVDLTGNGTAETIAKFMDSRQACPVFYGCLISVSQVDASGTPKNVLRTHGRGVEVKRMYGDAGSYLVIDRGREVWRFEDGIDRPSFVSGLYNNVITLQKSESDQSLQAAQNLFGEAATGADIYEAIFDVNSDGQAEVAIMISRSDVCDWMGCPTAIYSSSGVLLNDARSSGYFLVFDTGETGSVSNIQLIQPSGARMYRFMTESGIFR